jgi:single-stranded-DNA-specific exonuclease
MLSDIHPLLARIYNHRGIQATLELELGLEKLLPFSSLLNIEKAVDCLVAALQQQQRIMIIGDFDADGATSTAFAVSALRAFGAKNVSYLVPNRFEFGYGLTPEIVAVAARKTPDLIITVDNGITSIDGVTHAKQLGIKVLITDHHLPASHLPEAEAIVNPNQPNDLFPSKNLAGVGVIFYIMLALRARLRELNWFIDENISEPNMGQFLDLVALGTVADVVTLDRNNRILVRQGLQRIRAGKSCIGIKALLTIAGRNSDNVQAADLGFVVAPRLNAAGRLDDMTLGIECLLSKDSLQANDIAIKLDTLNRERQAIEENMQQQAFQALKTLSIKSDSFFGICLYDEKWHQGVIGILASRVKDQMHRPVIAFARINDNELKGSARSITGVHIRDVLADIAAKYPDILLKFGGHAMAAGVQLLQKNFAVFSQIFDREIQRRVNVDDLENKVYSDGELSLEDFSISIAETLRAAGPWGQGFPEPIFDDTFYVLKQQLIGQRHLKMTLSLESCEKKILDAIAFNIDTKLWPNQRCEKIQAAYRLDINEYRGLKNLQLIIEHLEPIE